VTTATRPPHCGSLGMGEPGDASLLEGDAPLQERCFPLGTGR
jgi:hypothetical protein